jgi:membrane protease YdiL (CAAX protease family)
LPGLLFLPVFLLAASLVEGTGLPQHLVPSLAAFLLAIIPFELGYLLYQGKRLNGNLSLRGVILYQESMPWWQFIVLGLPMLAWAAFVFAVIGPPVDGFFVDRFFSWMPDSFFPETSLQSLDQYPRSSLVITGIALVIVIGIVVPVVEELFFRGYLLPRIPLRGGWAPAVHIVLFSIYHFWLPWQNATRILAMSPLYLAVWWKRNVYLGIVWHVIANTLNTLHIMALILEAE